MINEQTKKIIDIIKNMHEKDKLRLSIVLCDSDFSNVNFNKKVILARADKRLCEIDEEYRTTIVNFTKYKLVMYTMAKIMEMENAERIRVTLYLTNNI